MQARTAGESIRGQAVFRGVIIDQQIPVGKPVRLYIVEIIVNERVGFSSWTDDFQQRAIDRRISVGPERVAA